MPLPITSGSTWPVDSTVTTPSRALAEPNQQLKPVMLPRIGAAT